MDLFEKTNVPRSFRGGEAWEQGNTQGGRVEATPSFREISGKRGDVGVIQINLKYKNDKFQQ